MNYDFGGFPASLYAQRYPAPGAPAVAEAAAAGMGPRAVSRHATRGLDHGAWTVLRHLYPAARVPVFQVSIDITRGGEHQVAIGRALAALREQQVLIIGSGNVVHNLRATQRGAADAARGSTDWADGFDQQVKAALDAHDLDALAWPQDLGPHTRMAVPFPDHYWPLLTAAGAAQSGERPQHVFEGFQAGTISMRCVQWG
jgi:4,5-DOPA dioxygenase extradiol